MRLGSNMYANNYSSEPEQQSSHASTYYYTDPPYPGNEQDAGPSSADTFHEYNQGSHSESISPTNATHGSSQEPNSDGPLQYEYDDPPQLPQVEASRCGAMLGFPASIPINRSPSYVSDYGEPASQPPFSPPLEPSREAEIHHRHSITQFQAGPQPWYSGDHTEGEIHRQELAASHPEHPDLIEHPRGRDWRDDKVPTYLTELEKEEQKIGKKGRKAKRKDRCPPMENDRYRKDQDRRGGGRRGAGQSSRV